MGLPSQLCVPHFGVRLVRKIQNEAADDEHRRSLLANYQSALPEGRYGLPGILAKYRDQSIGRNHPVSLSLSRYSSMSTEGNYRHFKTKENSVLDTI